MNRLKGHLRIWIILTLTFTVVATVNALNTGDTLRISGDAFTRDPIWVKECWCGPEWHHISHCIWVIHANVGSWMNQYRSGSMDATFPGPSGQYRVAVGFHAKFNGKSNYKVKVNDQEIASGLTPQHGTYDHDGCFPLVVNENVQLKQGDKVTYWADVSWPKTNQGVYGGMYNMEFILKGEVEPVIKLDQSKLTFKADEGGSNPPAQTINVSNGGGKTLPALSVSGNPSWVTVSVEGSGNSQKLKNSVTISGLNAQKHVGTVNVSGAGVDPVNYTVELTVVAPPVFTKVQVTPAKAAVEPGKTQQFQAKALDQYDTPLAVQPAFEWSTGSGTITTVGVYTAPSATGGPYHVTAKATIGPITKEGFATVTVDYPPPVHLKINAGASGTNNIDGWESQANYVTGGKDFAITRNVEVQGVDSAAPMEVYQTCRHAEPRFHFPASKVPDGKYTVRLHFAEPYFEDPQSSNRDMSVFIEGQEVLSNFNVAREANGGFKAFVWEKEGIQIGDGNGLSLRFEEGPNGGDAFVSGIEIIGGKKEVEITATPVPMEFGRSLLSRVRPWNRTQLAIEISLMGEHHISVTTVDGSRLFSKTGTGPAAYCLEASRYSTSVLLVRVQSGKRVFLRRVFVQ